VLLTAAIATGRAGAQAPTTDSVRVAAPDSAAIGRGEEAGPDSSRVIEIPAARAAASRPAPQPIGFDQPRWVMLRSLVVPGWGQLHNGAWVKALMVAAGEGALGVQILNDERELDRLFAAAEAARIAQDGDRYNDLIDAYNARVDASTGRRWVLGGVLLYALLDAYIDAHFAHFGVEFKGDPALPDGPPASRLSVRWTW
jgi:hypothetical protein